MAATFKDVNGGDLQDSARRNDHKLAKWVTQNTVPTAGFRNAIINGAFDVCQRGTAVSVSNTLSYTADQWVIVASSAGSAMTFNRYAHVPPGAELIGGSGNYYGSFGWTVGADSVNGYNGIIHNLEGVQQFAGQTVTLSFWASGAGSPNIGLEVEQVFGTGGSPSATVQTQLRLISLTATPQKFSITFKMPSMVGKTIGTDGNDKIGINFWLALGSTYVGRGSGVGFQSGVGKNVNLWAVQLEAGSIATPFERRPYAVEFAMCQRYFQRIVSGTGSATIGTGVFYTSTSAYVHFDFPQMRKIPIVTLNGGVGQFIVLNTSNQAPATMVVDAMTTRTGSINMTVALAQTTGGAAVLRHLGSGSSIDLSAEL